MVSNKKKVVEKKNVLNHCIEDEDFVKNVEMTQ